MWICCRLYYVEIIFVLISQTKKCSVNFCLDDTMYLHKARGNGKCIHNLSRKTWRQQTKCYTQTVLIWTGQRMKIEAYVQVTILRRSVCFARTKSNSDILHLKWTSNMVSCFKRKPETRGVSKKMYWGKTWTQNRERKQRGRTQMHTQRFLFQATVTIIHNFLLQGSDMHQAQRTPGA